MARNKTVDLKIDSIKSLFRYYLLSAIIGMIIKSIHIVLDGIFVGRGVSENALAAVNIVMPMFNIFMGIAMLIGIGGSALASIKFGEENKEEAQSIFSFSMIFLLLWSVLGQVIYFSNPEGICRLLGANDVIMAYTLDYATILTIFAPVFILGIGLSVFVRNDKDPTISMYGMIFSAVVNMILNYIFIFIFEWGIAGAALATGISQFVNVGILSIHFIKKRGVLKITLKNVYFSMENTIKSLKIGFPSFISEISFGIMSLIFNLYLMRLGGEIAVAAFSIMFYITTLMFMMFFGIGQAMQPIISFNKGAHLYDRIREIFFLGIKTGIILGIGFSIIGHLSLERLVSIFIKDNDQLLKMAIDASYYVFFIFAFSSVNIIISTYFQAIGDAKNSTILIILRSVLVNGILLMILANTFGLSGIWLVYPLGEVISFVIGILFMKYRQNIIAY